MLVQTQKQAFEVVHLKILFIWKDVGVSATCPDDRCFVRYVFFFFKFK